MEIKKKAEWKDNKIILNLDKTREDDFNKGKNISVSAKEMEYISQFDWFEVISEIDKKEFKVNVKDT